MNPVNIKAVAIAAGIALLAGFGAGWTVQGWRKAGEVNKLEGIVSTQTQAIATLKGANERCTAGVDEVRAAVKGYVDASEKRAREAAGAMERAAKASAGHLQAAREALDRPMPKAGEECDTAAAEAAAYARKRKAAP